MIINVRQGFKLRSRLQLCCIYRNHGQSRKNMINTTTIVIVFRFRRHLKPKHYKSNCGRIPVFKTLMLNDLPEAVVVEILVHLPPTSLLRCMSVCKAWNKIIKSQTFIYLHLQRSLSKPTPLFVKQYHYRNPSLFREEHYILYSNATLFPLKKITNLEKPFQVPIGYVYDVHLVGSLHSIICLVETVHYHQVRVILWNPFIQRRIIIPSPRVNKRDWIALGFGFDSKKNDYKVICVCFFPASVELYSLNEGAWRAINTEYVLNAKLGIDPLLLTSNTGCFFNGNVHWIGHDYCFPKYIFMFDVEDEKFNKMELPCGASYPIHIIVTQGCLSVVEFNYGLILERICNIWMMREYGVAKSWTKICSVRLQGGIEQVFGLSQSAKVLVIPKEKGKQGSSSLYSFDTKNQEIVPDLQIQDQIEWAFDCTESLLLLDKERQAKHLLNTFDCGM